jgi:hypothetical protein
MVNVTLISSHFEKILKSRRSRIRFFVDYRLPALKFDSLQFHQFITMQILDLVNLRVQECHVVQITTQVVCRLC